MAPADNGLSLGAIGFYLLKFKKKNFRINKYGLNPFLGPSFSQEEVIKIISKFNLKYEIPKNPHYDIAKDISKRKIVGVFDGRAEFGQRSLGNRSILANPLIKNMKSKLNIQVKHRENWRPFCPSINDYKYREYFGNVPESDFMILAFKVRNKYRYTFPSAVHVDGTARPQIVKKKNKQKIFQIDSRI